MNTTAQLNALKSRVGFHETGNNGNPFGPWQGIGSGSAWCDSFAQWGAAGNGGFVWPANCQFGAKGDAYCPFTKDHAIQLGIWRASSSNPKPGWQVLFDWDHNGVADHIGTVFSNGWQSDGTIITIEGNYNDQVAYVKRDRTFILGFVALEDTVVPPKPTPGPTPRKKEDDMPTVRIPGITANSPKDENGRPYERGTVTTLVGTKGVIQVATDGYPATPTPALPEVRVAVGSGRPKVGRWVIYGDVHPGKGIVVSNWPANWSYDHSTPFTGDEQASVVNYGPGDVTLTAQAV